MRNIDVSMIFSLAKNDFKAKYAGSALGIVWAFIQPVVTILIYWFVFQVAFQNQPVKDVPYVLWLVSGMVPWMFFSEAWGGATSSLTDYSYLVKKVVFDVRLLPFIRILSALFVHLFFVLLIFVITFCYGLPLKIIYVQAIYYMFAAIILLLAVGRLTAAFMAFFRDTGNLVGMMIQFGFWLTPIFWSVENLPSNLVWIFKLNPVYYIVEGYRDTFVFNVWFFQHPVNTAVFWIACLVLLLLGNIMFKRLKPHLADVL